MIIVMTHYNVILNSKPQFAHLQINKVVTTTTTLIRIRMATFVSHAHFTFNTPTHSPRRAPTHATRRGPRLGAWPANEKRITTACPRNIVSQLQMLHLLMTLLPSMKIVIRFVFRFYIWTIMFTLYTYCRIKYYLKVNQ